MKSRLIKYVERYLRFQPASHKKLQSADLNMVGRSFSQLPLTFTQQFTLNTVIDSTLMQEWSELCLTFVSRFKRNEEHKIDIQPEKTAEIFHEFVLSVIQFGLQELFDESANLHSQIIFLFGLKALIQKHGEPEVATKILWSFCHDIVSTGLLPLFKESLLPAFPNKREKEDFAEIGMNFTLAFSQECTMDVVNQAIVRYKLAKAYETKLIYIEANFLLYLQSMPEIERNGLKDIISLDTKQVVGFSENSVVTKKIIKRRHEFWFDVIQHLDIGERKIRTAITLGLQSYLNPHPKNQAEIVLPVRLQKWLNARDNYFLIQDIIRFASFQAEDVSKMTIEKLKKIRLQQAWLELSLAEFIDALAGFSPNLKAVLDRYMPSCKPSSQLNFFTKLISGLFSSSPSASSEMIAQPTQQIKH